MSGGSLLDLWLNGNCVTGYNQIRQEVACRKARKPVGKARKGPIMRSGTQPKNNPMLKRTLEHYVARSWDGLQPTQPTQNNEDNPHFLVTPDLVIDLPTFLLAHRTAVYIISLNGYPHDLERTTYIVRP